MQLKIHIRVHNALLDQQEFVPAKAVIILPKGQAKDGNLLRNNQIFPQITETPTRRWGFRRAFQA